MTARVAASSPFRQWIADFALFPQILTNYSSETAAVAEVAIGSQITIDHSELAAKSRTDPMLEFVEAEVGQIKSCQKAMNFAGLVVVLTVRYCQKVNYSAELAVAKTGCCHRKD